MRVEDSAALLRRVVIDRSGGGSRIPLVVDFNGLTRQEVVQFALGSTKDIDFAVPQEWADDPRIAARYETGAWAVWDYRAGDVWGSPLWSDQLSERIRKEAAYLVSQLLLDDYD